MIEKSRPTTPTKSSGVRLTLALLALTASASMVGLAASPSSASTTTPQSNPVYAGGQARNVVFNYDSNIPLVAGADLSSLGHPSIVVSTRRADESGAVDAIHSIGAKAYRYVQFYWAPSDAEYEGIDLQTHPDWAFCGANGSPSLGRTTDGTRKWYFVDTNEKAVRAQIKATLVGLRAQGWDGVMFDRGEAATQYAADSAGRAIWHRSSTCTGDPATPGATFSDAYVRMLGLARTAGLSTMLNTGKSAFDPVAPLRPNPKDKDCRAQRWSRCSHLNDAWANTDVVLNETATAPRDTSWRRMYVGNSRAERDRAYGHRTIALVTTHSLGGGANQTRPRVYFAWSRIKLFNLSTAINTGASGCAGVTGVCNQYGYYPELTDLAFGKPLGKRPAAQNCARRSKVHCVWVRRYSAGADVVNVQKASKRKVRVALGTSSCRYVYDVYTNKPLANNTCVRAVKMNLSAWTGRPLKYSRTRW